MAALETFTRRIAGKLGEKGSALLVTLMVVVGLSLIGLGYVALSETESAIAVNERNSAQTLHVAETAGLMVIEWFQNPAWAREKNLMPANIDAIKVVRTLVDGAGAPTYTGRYKSSATNLLLFDKPYKKSSDDRFFGTEANPDILINDRTHGAWLAQFNIHLFNRDSAATAAANCGGCDNREGGRVTEIRVFAPPIDGGTVNNQAGWSNPAASGIPAATGFYQGGTRFGLASIRVTATKFNRPDCGPYVAGCRTVAQRSVKFVIAEWPFPGPQGPIQSNANVGTTGNYHIHWGKITSTLDTDLKRPYTSIPWIDAYNQTPFERGYEEASDDANAKLTKVWPTDTKSTNNLENHAWLNELIGRSFEDPWYQARARGRITQMSGTDTAKHSHQYRYEDPSLVPGTPSCDPCNAGKGASPGQSNMFQFQTKSELRYYTNALFPRVDYDFWKQVAISADTQDNIYYLRWTSKDQFEDRAGNVRTFRQWVDVMANPPAGEGPKSKPGFYFFDTENKQNPQNNRGGIMTPKISMSGGNMQMKGFVYVNTADLSITGLDGYAGYYNMPGEVYRDIGFRQVEVDPTALNYKGWKKRDNLGIPCTTADTSNCVTFGAANNIHDFQDLPWSNGNATAEGNEEFDVYVAERDNLSRDSAPTDVDDEYYVVTWYPGCNPGRNGGAGSPNCSEPHEPYLNFIYPDPATPTGAITVRWQAPGSETRRRKTNPNGVVPNAALPTCAGASIKDCTSNSYDRDGALVALSPILDGVLYNEGKFGSAGNANYFGSLMFDKSVEASGTPNIWFDEKLVKGAWPPGNFGFPRVYITTYETEH